MEGPASRHPVHYEQFTNTLMSEYEEKQNLLHMVPSAVRKGPRKPWTVNCRGSVPVCSGDFIKKAGRRKLLVRYLCVCVCVCAMSRTHGFSGGIFEVSNRVQMQSWSYRHGPIVRTSRQASSHQRVSQRRSLLNLPSWRSWVGPHRCLNSNRLAHQLITWRLLSNFVPTNGTTIFDTL